MPPITVIPGVSNRGFPGASNYERARALQGFVGTEQEYLASLRGADADTTELIAAVTAVSGDRVVITDARIAAEAARDQILPAVTEVAGQLGIATDAATSALASAQAAAASLEGSEGARLVALLADQKATPYASRAAVLAAEVPEEIQFISVAGKLMVDYVGDLGAAVTSANGRDFMPVSSASPFEFGAVCDGLSDDTEPMRRLHAWCNLIGVPPEFARVQRFAIQANAEIQINTDLDLNSATINVLNGIVAAPSWNNVKSRVYVVEDPNCPIFAGDVAVNGLQDFHSGSYTTSRGLIPGEGWLAYHLMQGENLPLLSDRNGVNTLSWRCCHRVFYDGTTQYPLPINAIGVTSVFREYRLNSDKPIMIRNFAVDVSRFNEQIIFDIQRNQVTVDGYRLFAGGGMPEDMVVEIIRPFKCSEIAVSKPQGRPPSNSSSSYVFSPTWVADFQAGGAAFRQQGGNTWWWMAARWCNGMHYGPGYYDRIDIHSYSLNLFVYPGAQLTGRGIMIGHGGGLLVADGVTFHQTFSGWGVINARNDYGCGSWDGEIIVRNPTIVSAFLGNPLGAIVVNLPNVGNAAIPVSMPRVITVTDVVVSRPTNDQNPMIIVPVFIRANPTSAGVYAPASILIDGVQCSTRWSMHAHLDLANFLSPPTFGTDGTDIRIGNAGPTHRRADFPLLQIPATAATNRVGFQIHVTISDVDLVTAEIAAATAGSYLRVRGGSVSRVVAPNNIAVHYDDTEFRDPLLIGAEAVAPLCAVKNASIGYSTINGGRISGAFNLANFHAISGLASREGLAAALPASVTREQLFGGWMA